MAKTRKKPSFEESVKELEGLVSQLEGGEKGLEESLRLFERGVALSRELTKDLEEAKHKVDVLVREQGRLTAKPLEGA